MDGKWSCCGALSWLMERSVWLAAPVPSASQSPDAAHSQVMSQSPLTDRASAETTALGHRLAAVQRGLSRGPSEPMLSPCPSATVTQCCPKPLGSFSLTTQKRTMALRGPLPSTLASAPWKQGVLKGPLPWGKDGSLMYL
jgi:hypothetical protein